MILLVFSEVLEMSSEVAGPGPTHGRSNLLVLTRDLLLVPSRPMPNACYPLVLFVVCVFLLCGKFCTNHVSSSQKKIIQREKKKKVSGEANEKKGKKKVDCHPYPIP